MLSVTLWNLTILRTSYATRTLYSTQNFATNCFRALLTHENNVFQRFGRNTDLGTLILTSYEVVLTFSKKTKFSKCWIFLNILFAEGKMKLRETVSKRVGFLLFCLRTSSSVCKHSTKSSTLAQEKQG